MSTTDIGLVFGIAVSILVAAFLAMSETALTRASRFKVMQMVEEEVKGAHALARLLEDPPRFLNVILFLLLAVQLAGATMATLVSDHISRSYGWAISTFGMTMLIFVFAEAAPKTYAIQHADRVAVKVAPFVSWLIRVPGLQGLMRALVAIANVVTPGKGLARGPFVSEQEIRTMAEVAAEEDSIEEEEKEMIHSIFEFGDTVVREVMVPRPDMVGVAIDEDLPDVLTLMLEHGFSRMPVWEEENSSNVVGLVYAKDVMRRLHGRKRGNGKKEPARPARLKDLLRKAAFVPESKKVAELLREMQADKTHMAIVVDEYGDIAGLVTMEDLLEEIVGEIADEYDREEPQVQPIDDQTLRVSGRLQIDELSELLDVELPDNEWDTVGGLMAGLLGKVPQQGDNVEFQGLQFRAERVHGRRIDKVLITRGPTTDAKPEALAQK
jgi:CBS domain containing-hemolysin-like protein